MPRLSEDSPYERGESSTSGVVPDWVEGAKLSRRTSTSYREAHEGQGPAINALLAREVTKEENLRARLHDLGIERERTKYCFVIGHVDPSRDSVNMPWSIIYDLLNRYDGRLNDGGMGAMR